MKNLLTALFVLLFLCEIDAQCSAPIISNSSIGSAVYIDTINIDHWLCPGDSVIGTGGNGYYLFMESGSFVNQTDGNGHRFWVKGNSTVILNGVINQLELYYEPTVTVINNLAGGTGNTIMPCPTVTFDYTEAPNAPCHPSAGLTMTETNSPTLYKITDLMGRETEDRPNTPLIYVYSDGTTEKVYRME